MNELTYEQWNEELCRKFFLNRTQNKIIYLYVNEDIIHSIGSTFGLSKEESIESFCLCVKTYKDSLNANQLFKKAYNHGKLWSKTNMQDLPPFIAVLGLCVLAATKMKSDEELYIGGGNYYYRLRELIDDFDIRISKPRYFEKTIELWNMLMKWQERHKGKYGFTHAFPFGSKYTGYARSQCLIRDSEREQLEHFFRWAGYKPGADLKHEIVEKDLESYLITKIGRLNRLYFQKTSGIRDSLVRLIINEFKLWNGCQPITQEYNKESYSYKTIDVFLHLEFLTNTLKPMPKLNFLAYSEDIHTDILDGIEYRNQYFKWPVKNGLELCNNHKVTINGGYKLHYNSSNILFFRRGNDLGLKGWASRKDIVPCQEHWLLFIESLSTVIFDWVEKNNYVIKNKTVKFIDGWKGILISVSENINHFNILNDIGCEIKLSSEMVSISLRDGLKVRNTEWMVEGSPFLSVIAPKKSIVYLNDEPIATLANGSDLIDLKSICTENILYQVRVGEKTKNFRLCSEFAIKTDNTISKKITYRGESIRVSGAFIDFNLENLPEPFYYDNHRKCSVITKGNKQVIMKHPKNIKAEPFTKFFKNTGIIKNSNNISSQDIKSNTRPIDIFLEYLSVLGSGNWNKFLQGVKTCFGDDNLALRAYEIRKALSRLGFVDFYRDGNSNHFDWVVTPTSAAVLPCKDIVAYITGARTRKNLSNYLNNIFKPGLKFIGYYPNSEKEPIYICVIASEIQDLISLMNKLNIRVNLSENYFAYDLARCSPTIEDLINQSSDGFKVDSPRWKYKGWNIINDRWENNTNSRLLKCISDFGHSYYLLEFVNSKYIKVDPEIGKCYIASKNNKIIMTYYNYLLKVKLQYILPDIYDQILTSCSGCCPIETSVSRIYKNVPLEIAYIVANKLGLEFRWG